MQTCKPVQDAIVTSESILGDINFEIVGPKWSKNREFPKLSFSTKNYNITSAKLNDKYLTMTYEHISKISVLRPLSAFISEVAAREKCRI